MRKIGSISILILVLIAIGLLGCSEDNPVVEISLEDAAKLYFYESPTGSSLYGFDVTYPETLSADAPQISPDPITWTAEWDFRDHYFHSVDFDTTTDRGVPGLRSADMAIWDTVLVQVTIEHDDGTILEKSNRAVAKSRALLIQLGTYGMAWHGWVLRQYAERGFNSARFNPAVPDVRMIHVGETHRPSSTLRSIDDVPRFAQGDSITCLATTNSSDHLLYLNVLDSGTIIRKRMEFDESVNAFRSGWRIANTAPRLEYFQAFVEAYAPETWTSPDTLAVNVSAQNFVYRIQ